MLCNMPEERRSLQFVTIFKTHLHLALRSRTIGALPLLRLCALIAWRGITSTIFLPPAKHAFCSVSEVLCEQ